MQIRARLTLQFILVVTLIILFGFGVIYYSSSSYRKNELYQRLENKARTSAEIFISVEQIDSTMLRIFDKTQRDKLPYENVSIYDFRDREIYTNNDTLAFEVGKELLDEIRLDGRKEFTEDGFEVLGMTYNDKFNRFVVFAGAIDTYGISKLNNLRFNLIVLFFIIISIVALSGWIYAGRALKPLVAVVDQVEEMNIDRLDNRLSPGNHKDEIGRLINTFNTLLDRIEHAFGLQKLFLSGASHELKNPLTSITSQLQVVLIKDRSGEEYRQLLNSILEDIKNLNKTTLDLIEFSRLNYENRIELTDVRIDDVLWYCREYFNKTKPACHIHLELDNMPDDGDLLAIKANEPLIRIAFINLIDNACKFSADHTCTIRLETDPETICISFSDRGVGLSQEEIGLIFEPFYRSNSTAETQGHGIGLALTRKIIQLHNARIDLHSVKGSGTTFFIRFKQNSKVFLRQD